MAHTPKPIRKAAKAARRQRGPRFSFGRSGYGRTVIVNEKWTIESAAGVGWTQFKNDMRAARIPHGQRVHQFDLTGLEDRNGGIPFIRQYPSDLGSEYLDLIDRNGGMLINMQALRTASWKSPS